MSLASIDLIGSKRGDSIFLNGELEIVKCDDPNGKSVVRFKNTSISNHSKISSHDYNDDDYCMPPPKFSSSTSTNQRQTSSTQSMRNQFRPKPIAQSQESELNELVRAGLITQDELKLQQRELQRIESARNVSTSPNGRSLPTPKSPNTTMSPSQLDRRTVPSPRSSPAENTKSPSTSSKSFFSFLLRKDNKSPARLLPSTPVPAAVTHQSSAQTSAVRGQNHRSQSRNTDPQYDASYNPRSQSQSQPQYQEQTRSQSLSRRPIPQSHSQSQRNDPSNRPLTTEETEELIVL